MKAKSKIWYLSNFNFFEKLDLEQRTFICQNTVMRKVEKGSPIYFQEDLAHSIYFLKEGIVKISRLNLKGQELVIAILGPGEIFGESSVLNHHKRKDAAIAEEQVVYCVMQEDKMKELLLKAPILNLHLSEIIENRLEKAEKRLEDLCFKNNQERILEFLYETAANVTDSPNGEIVIPNTFTHKKIALLTSTNRQEVSAVFGALKKKGVIDYNRKMIKILNLQELQESFQVAG